MGNATVSKTKHILIVDDDPLMREVLSQSLKNNGYTVETAEDGKKALDKLGAGPPPAFAAVLLDLEMPVLGGMETLASIKRTTPELPVIVLTARRTKEVIQEARELGAFDYIIKPPDLDRVETLLAACCT